MLSRMEAGKKGGGGSSNQKKLLKDVETINKAMYLDRTSSRSSISSANSRSKFTGKSQLPDPKSKSKVSGDSNDDGVQKDKRSIWNWRPLRALSHIRNKRFNCSFYLQVHLIEGLPPSFDDASLAVYWKRRDGVLVTGPAKVIHCVAEFEEKLTYTCSVYGSRSGPHHSAKYEAKHFLLYASLLSAPELDLGKHRVDLTRLLPLTLEELEEEKSSGKWTTSFRLSGVAKGAVLNVSFGYMVVGDNASASRESHNAPNVLRQNSLSLMKADAKPKPFEGSNRMRRATSVQYSPQVVDEVKDLHEVLPSSKSALANSIDILYKKFDEEKACDLLRDEAELDSFTENLEPIKPDVYASDLGKERPEEHVGKDENACPVHDKPELNVIQEKLETVKPDDNPLPDSANENPEQYQGNEFFVVDKGIELSSNGPVELEESVIKPPEDASTVDTACTLGISGIQVSSEDSVKHDFLDEANNSFKDQAAVEEFASIKAPEEVSTIDTTCTLGISGIQESSEDSVKHDYLDEANALDTSELLLQELESALNSVSNLERVALESPKITEAKSEHKMTKSHSLDDVTDSVAGMLTLRVLSRSVCNSSTYIKASKPYYLTLNFTTHHYQHHTRRNLILESSSSQFIKLHQLSGPDSGIVEISLDRPEAKNAIGNEMLRGLRHAFELINQNSYAKVAVITSSVPGVFCAGADLKERRGMSPAEVKNCVNSLRSTFSYLEAVHVPTIAVIEGVALGGGLEMALACDMRICGQNALMGLPETGLAIIPGAGGTQRLPRLVGKAIAKDIIFTGRKIDGREALSLGLVNYCVSAGEAYSKALAIARDINQKGPVAIKMAKRAINEGVETDLTSALVLEEDCYDQVLHTKDRLEGLAAFAEKRKPNYTGE